MSPEFTDTARAALLWVLWHHQGGSSPVGQPIRFALGMGQHDHLSPTQLAEARRWDEIAARSAAPSEDDDDAPYVPTAIDIARAEGYAAGVRHGESLTAAPSGVSDATVRRICNDYEREVNGAIGFSANRRATNAMRAALEKNLPIQPQPGRVSDATCPHCGAPCRKEVLMRGGDNGWGDDASRTVFRYRPQEPDHG
jgi:hypothetical protein